MPASRNRISRFLTDSRPPCDAVLPSLSNFYREEFQKCQRCLDQQREFYSEHAISEVEKALTCKFFMYIVDSRVNSLQ